MSWTREARIVYMKDYHKMAYIPIEPKAIKREREAREYEDNCNKAHRETRFKDQKDEII